MITEESHPAMIQAQHELLRRLGIALKDGRQELTKPLLDSLFTVIKDHRAEFRLQGVDFPVMVALVVPRLGIVEFKRADLDVASLRITIVNFVRQYQPHIKMDEVVAAFRMAYPDLRPGDIFQQHDTGIKQTERMHERMDKVVEDMKKETGEDEGDVTRGG